MAEEFIKNGKRTMIIAHKGGFKPDNSLRAFKEAIRHGFEGIEFDVWLSKDNVLMVLHGGYDGELKHYGKAFKKNHV